MILLQGLHFFQALGIALFGGMLATLMGMPEGWSYTAHWFCGALMMYNLDRSLPDAADARNQPERFLRQLRFRRVSFALSIASGMLLLALPIRDRDWQLLVILGVGGLLCACYSVPVLGRRFKDLPVVGSFFPPLAIAVALILLPSLDVEMVPAQRVLVGMIGVWTFLVLLVNVVVCDLRDRVGDEAAGVVSLAVFLGEFETRKLVRAANTAAAGIALLIGFLLKDTKPAVVMLMTNAYLAVVLRLYPPPPQHQALYDEWLLDGFLYVAPVAALVVYWWAA